MAPGSFKVLSCLCLLAAFTQSLVEARKIDRSPVQKTDEVAPEKEHEDKAESPADKEDLEEPTIKVTKNNDIKIEALDECYCGLGKFWHPGKQACVKQGSKGFNCTGIPEARWHTACTDGLICKAPDADDERSDSQPSPICVDCNPNDHCQWGEDRHKKFCMKTYKVTGEACATVDAKVPPSRVKVSVTKSVTVKAVGSKDVPAKATETATAKSSAGTKVTGEATADLKVTYKKEVTKTSSAKRTASGESTGSATVTSCAKLTHFRDGKTADKALADEAAKEAMDVAVKEATEEAIQKAKKNAVSAAKAEAIAEASKEAAEVAEKKATEEARKAAKEAVKTEAKEYAEKKAQEKAEEKAREVAKSAADEITEKADDAKKK